MRFKGALLVAALATAFLSAVALADTHPVAPNLSSRPGAAYTIYLDFSGFNYTGTWAGSTPGATPAYTSDGDATTFSTAEQATIKNLWSRIAEKYIAFNINVTTIDPAIAAGQADTDAHRQAYYDATVKMEHTVIGGSGTWFNSGKSGGVSYVGTAQSYYGTSANAGAGSGYHTDWLFAAEGPDQLGFVADGAAHEIGHSLSLNHQADYDTVSKKLISEYSTNGGSTGAGTYAPIMGTSYYTQRGLWRIGTLDNGAIQNDITTLLSNGSIGGFMDDGVGHSMGSATTLTLSTTTITTAANWGFITPNSTSNPTAIGQNNYTKDYFKFYTGGGAVSITLNDGAERIIDGTIDEGTTLDGYLVLLDSSGNVIATATDPNAFTATIATTLAAGFYCLEIESAGGKSSSESAIYGNSSYFDMGSYFLSGTIPVPEPSGVAVIVLSATFLLHRRRRAVA